MDADNIPKKYYSISEVAELFEVNTSLIRFWESEFEILNPMKNKNGERRFTPKDIENFKMIYHLVKEKGFTLEGAKEELKKDADYTREKLQTIESLQKVKEFLSNLREQID